MATRWAGVFYLAARILELDLGSHLWQAGIHEAPFLTALARHLCGREVATDPAPRVLGLRPFALAPRAPEHRRLGRGTKFVAKLDRSLAEACKGRDLPTPETSLTTAVNRLEPDERGWLDELTASPATARSLAAASEALRTRILGALERKPTLANLRPHLHVSGRIELAANEGIEIHMPMAASDLALRRAGLDFDPGWLPWLEAKLRFVFEAGEGERW